MSAPRPGRPGSPAAPSGAGGATATLERPEARRRHRGALSGAGAVCTGVVGAGLFTYLFLGLAGRTLGPADLAPVSNLWAMAFVIGPGLFLPMQQEIARVIAGQRAERGGRQGVVKVAVLALGTIAVAVGGLLAAADWMTRELLGGSEALMACFVAAVPAFAVNFVVRGILSGLGDFTGFAQIVAAESFSRLALAGLLVLVGPDSQVMFGVALAAAPVLAVPLVIGRGRRVRLTRGHPVGWHAAGQAIGWLVLASFMMQLLANAGPLAVQLLATPEQQTEAARFFTALVIARATLFLFQAIQATVLPNLAELVATHAVAELKRSIRNLVVLCLALTVGSAVAGWFVGAWLTSLMFGAEFVVPDSTMSLLAAASSIQVLGVVLSGAAIAAAAYHWAALGWTAGCVALGLGLLVDGDLFERVQTAYLLGSVVGSLVLLVGVVRFVSRLRPPLPADPADLPAG